jgi:hypothetical protein
MIPLGYCTIPEALILIDGNINSKQSSELDWLEAGLLDGELSVFVQRAREYDVEVCRIPYEDICELGRDWGNWIRSGSILNGLARSAKASGPKTRA